MATPLRSLAFIATALLCLGACTSAPATTPESASSEASTPTSAQEKQAQATPMIIDVRTPEEFAEGHVEGAVNIDVTAPDFAAKIAELDPSGNYALYCRSGNRSGQAASFMAEQKFTHITNLGSLDEASAALDLPIVR